ncbi:unnamed protein product [Effrenium voratum]|uniref:SET domain-containing protein n=1 Tax=Effrenium voratum TaxID=2562239 RepID=A0AA36MI92_9DINO|nr:unnamed protein product [Effrenium voratum]
MASLAPDTSWEDIICCRESRFNVGCYYLGELQLEQDQLQGFGFSAVQDLEANTVLLIERALTGEALPCFHPRSAAEIPRFLYLFPLCLISPGILDRLPGFLSALRARLNRFDALYGLGTIFNHSCRPNSRRLTDHNMGLSLIATSRAVKAGDEVTLPYQDFGRSCSAWLRRLVLFYGRCAQVSSWKGFPTSCPIRTSPWIRTGSFPRGSVIVMSIPSLRVLPTTAWRLVGFYALLTIALQLLDAVVD